MTILKSAHNTGGSFAKVDADAAFDVRLSENILTDTPIMTKPSVLSPDLLSEFSSQPRQHRDVLISCVGDVEHIKTVLEKAGIDIGGQINELGILHANIDYDDLIKIQKIPGIESIEIDEEVQGFQ